MTRLPTSLLVASVIAACTPAVAAASPRSPAQPIAGTVGVPGVAFDPIHDSAVVAWSDFAARAMLASARDPLS
jgi:hypothetical protein